MPNEFVNVEFTAKELFTKIERRLDDIVNVIGEKAGRVETEGIRNRLNGLELNGSNNAQQALRDVHDLDKRLTLLDKEAVRNEALAGAFREIDAARSSHSYIILGLLLNGLGVLVALFKLFH